MDIIDAHVLIEDKLNEIGKILGDGYALSFLARHKTNPDAHILLTRDPIATTKNALSELEQDHTEHNPSDFEKLKSRIGLSD